VQGWRAVVRTHSARMMLMNLYIFSSPSPRDRFGPRVTARTNCPIGRVAIFARAHKSCELSLEGAGR
jgi:hypothetical protein